MTQIVLLKKYNTYWSFEYFTQLLADAFKRRGYNPIILDFDYDIQELQRMVQVDDNKLFFTYVKIIRKSMENTLKHRNHRWVYLRVDPIEWVRDDIVADHKSYIGSVDEFETAYIKTFISPKNVQFVPHAIDPKLSYKEDDSRPYDVTFLGSSYDPLAIEQKINKLKPQGITFVYECIEKYQNDPTVTISQLVQPLETSLRASYHLLIDSYVRAKERVDMISAIKDAEVHIFGGTAFDTKEFPVRGWATIFKDKPNIVVHPGVPISESMDIMRKSKIVLNSMPFFKKGTHERVFNALALGAVPFTSKNLWFDEHFVNGQELVFYDRTQVNDQINELLSNDKWRRDIVHAGRAKVMRDHTYDNRADQLIRWLLHA